MTKPPADPGGLPRDDQPRSEASLSTGTDKGLLSAALEYAAGGLAVFPLRGKAPLTRRGFHDATTDPAQISAWWAEEPDRNIGAAVPLGCLGVDIDAYKPKAQEHFDRLVADLGPLPDCPTVDTGGGGVHLWFSVPPGLTFRAPGNGIDLRAGGKGYLVMPPSIHPNGRQYTWRDPHIELEPPELPAAWRDHLTATPTYRPSSRTSGPVWTPELGTAGWLAQLPGGRLDAAMLRAVDERTLTVRMRRAAHDTMRDSIFRCLSLGAEGHPGAQKAVGAISAAFLHEMDRRARRGEPGRGTSLAQYELQAAVAGAVARIARGDVA